ncbi:MAG: nickel/cobalt transporter, partial [Planctomycetota bacterium]
DKADLNLTQFINVYTDNKIENPVIDKDFFSGEERIFNISFKIREDLYNIIVTQMQPQLSNKVKTSRFYDRIKNYLTTRKISVFTFFTLTLFAFIFGVLHALEPGHGKSIITAYILASKGTIFEIFFLGLIIVITHTIIVYILTFITLYLSQFLLPHTLYPYLGFISSSLIIILGLNLIRRSASYNSQVQTGGHFHFREGFKSKDLIQFGISGGLLPCPAGIAILLTAIQLNQIFLGLILITALSSGIAATLICVGIIAFYCKKLIFRKVNTVSSKYVAILPLFSGIFITLLGTILFFKIFEDLRLFKVTLSL